MTTASKLLLHLSAIPTHQINMKVINPILISLFFSFCLVANAYSVQRMDVTIVNNGQNPITHMYVMMGDLLGEKKRVRELGIEGPISPGSSRRVAFEVPDIEYTVVGEYRYPKKTLAIEVRRGNLSGCKKLLDLVESSPVQTVNAGQKECGLYPDEKRSVLLFLEWADSDYSQKRYENAIGGYTSALGIDPKNEHALHRRGHSHSALGKYGPAITDFGAALEMTKDPAHLYTDRGLAYFSQKNWIYAVTDLSKAVALQPGNVNYLYYRSRALCEIGNKAGAAADEKKLVEMGTTIPKLCTPVAP